MFGDREMTFISRERGKLGQLMMETEERGTRNMITNFQWRGGGRGGGTRPFISGNMGTFTPPTTLGGPRECIVC